MSSTMSSSEIQTITKKPAVLAHRKLGDKSQRLVRTSSLDKIRRFNTFICSQQYYLLPSLLAWLRSSQSALQSSTETTIFFFRSLIFSNLVYKLYHVEYRALLSNVVVLTQKQVQSKCENVEKTVFLKVAVYVTAFVLVAELSLCFYLLWTTHVPGGLLFLIVCWFYIIYLNLKAACFYSEKKASDVKK